MDEIRQLLLSFPETLHGARQSLISNDRNALEWWHICLENHLDFLQVPYDRIAGIAPDDACLRGISTFWHEADDVFAQIDDELTTHDHGRQNRMGAGGPNNNENRQYGRPRIQVNSVDIIREFDIFRSWKVVAYRFGISEKTLRRRRQEFGMPVSNTSGPRTTYSQVSMDELCDIVRTVLNTLPDAGETLVIGSLRARGIHVQRRRI